MAVADVCRHLAGGYAGFYLTRKSFSIAKTGMGEGTEVGLLDTDMAWIDMGYLIAYAIGQFVWGITADKVGPRKVLLGGMLISILTGVAMGVSTLPLALGVFFFIQGLCQSTGWAPLTKNVSNFFSQRERGTIMGMWCTNYAVGGVVASALAAWAATQWGYQYAFFVPAGVLLCIWFLFVFCQRNRSRRTLACRLSRNITMSKRKPGRSLITRRGNRGATSSQC